MRNVSELLFIGCVPVRLANRLAKLSQIDEANEDHIVVAFLKL